MKNYFIGFIIGILIPYALQLLDSIFTDLANRQALKTTKIQVQIDKLNDKEDKYDDPNRIGFEMPNYEEEIED